MPALVLSLMPLGTAFAQSYLQVRVTREKAEIKSLRQVNEVKMTAPRGTVLDVFYVEGDRYAHLESNWYWVLLPHDAWGTRPAGSIRGDAIEHVPPPPPAPARAESLTTVPPVKQASAEPRKLTERESVAVAEAPVAPAAPAASAARTFVSDVVLNFEFGKSELTEEAKRKLSSAISVAKPNARGMSFALEGHADWIGTDVYNEQLGRARAESVRRYLAEQLRVPVDEISVVSYGESNPAAPNTTREGRAINRRVVIRGGA